MPDPVDFEIRQVLDQHADLCDPPFNRDRSAERKRLLNRLRVLFAKQNLEMIRTIERIERLSEELDDDDDSSWRGDSK